MPATLKSKLIAISFLALTIAANQYYAHASSQQGQPGDARINAALKGLWSPNESERESSRAELVEAGQKPVPALVSMLSDLKSNWSTPHFATGREKEGALLWRRFLDSTSGEVVDLVGIEITNRLEGDIMELLGELRAKEAIPLLVTIMDARMKDNWLRVRISPEMNALAKIGGPAIPALVKFIEDEPGHKLTAGSPGITDEEMVVFSNSHQTLAQTRAVIVLGEIGDEAALPVLERLLAQPNDPNVSGPDIRYVEDAVKKIKEKKK